MIRATPKPQIACRLFDSVAIFISEIEAQVSKQVLNDLTRDLFSVQLLTDYFDIEGCRATPITPDDYTCKLLKLTHYDCTEIKVKAFSLLVRHRGQREALACRLTQACLVMDVNLMFTIQKLEYEANKLRSTIK